MPIATHPPETDLVVPLPGPGEEWDPHTIHTHYFGFCVPEAELGAFLYVRYQPAFPLSQGGVALFRGTENNHVLDMAFLDYEITMPYPTIEGNSFTTANGLRIDFTDPGREARVTYRSKDGQVEIDVLQTAVTPLFARGHVMPGEEDHADPARSAGGSEQYMHATGQVTIRGETFDIDCHAPRDRSWRQVRTEQQGGARRMPPVGWSPMYFGPDLIFNQISMEAPDTDPAYAGLFEIPEGAPTHHYAWVHNQGETREITRVRRAVLARHPVTHVAMRQELEAEDETGATYRFTGEAIASTVMPAWPNTAFSDTVYRWEDEQGRVSHGTYQEIWADEYQRHMSTRTREASWRS